MTLAPTLKCNMAAEIPAPRNFKLWLILILSVDLITKNLMDIMKMNYYQLQHVLMSGCAQLVYLQNLIYFFIRVFYKYLVIN